MDFDIILFKFMKYILLICIIICLVILIPTTLYYIYCDIMGIACSINTKSKIGQAIEFIIIYAIKTGIPFLIIILYKFIKNKSSKFNKNKLENKKKYY